MDVFVILLSIGALGNYLGKNGKQSREQKVTTVPVSKNDMPSGPLIYDSHRVQEVDEYVLRKAAKKYPKSIEYQFPLDYNKPQSVVPSSTAGDDSFPASIGTIEQTSGLSQASQFEQAKKQLMAQNDPRVTPIDPQTGQMQSQSTQQVFGGPMFRSFQFKSSPSIVEGFQNQQISPLTGLPLDMTHANMQPHFKGFNRRANNEGLSGVMLEQFTGVDAGFGTYGPNVPKTEQPAQWNPPQNIRSSDLSDIKDLQERAKFAMESNSSNDYMGPVANIKDTSMDLNDMRFLPKSLDEINPNNARTVYTTPANLGTRSSTGLRSMIPQTIHKRQFLPSESGQMLPSRSAITEGPALPPAQVRDVRSTTTSFEYNWMAPPSNPNKSVQYSTEPYEARYEDAVIRKQDTFTPRFGNAFDTGSKIPTTTGVFIERVPEKGREQTYVQPAFDGRGDRVRDNVNAPEPTWQDMIDVSGHSGKLNRVDRTEGAYQNTDVELPVTNKAMNVENKYIGQAFNNWGQGIRQHGLVDFTTIKETLISSYTGNPKSLVTAHANQEAEFDEFVNREHQTSYVGPAQYPIKAAPNEDAEFMSGIDDTKLMVKDYQYGPDRIDEIRQDKDQFSETLTKDLFVRPEFGGYLTAVKDTTLPTLRDSEYMVTEDMSVEGRTNFGVVRQAGDIDQLPMAIAMKNDESTEIPLGNATVKTNVLANPGIEVRTVNNEALNPRLDPDVKITNDLFPFL